MDKQSFVMKFFDSFRRMVALVTVFFMPQLVGMIGTPILFDASLIRTIFMKAVETREQSGVKRGDYIDSIIALKNGKQNSIYKFEGENLLYQSGTFFSGFESSSTAAAFTLKELANNKEHQQLARDEIRRSIDKLEWTFEAFNEMKYLDQCICEALRLHPSIPTIDRYTQRDYKMPKSDTIIEKGTPIYISLYGLHRDPHFFDEPERFDPERSNPAGPRMCIECGTKHKTETRQEL